MSRTVITLLGLLALALLIFLCVRNHSTNIQTDIQNRTSNRLSDEPTTWAKVNTDGRNVLLSGIAPSEVLRNKAEEIALAVPGVVSVDNQIQLVKTAQASESIPRPESQSIHSPYTTQFTKTVSGITLSGLVPDIENRNTLIQLAENKFGVGNVIDQLKIGLGAPQNWLQTAKAAISNLALFKEGAANLTDNQLNLTGQVIDNDAKTAVANSLGQLPQSFRVNLDLTSPEVAVEESQDMVDQSSAASCADQFEQILTKRVIHFSTNSSLLKTQSQKAIKKILQFASICPNSIIEIAGHTDSRGAKSYNLALSQNRANATANKLIKKGFPANMLKIKGYGESNPSSDNMTARGQANNRRIEFSYLQEGE
jgi:outer membrane protein OmpA-like peptidoglycan-associated protein